MRHHSSLPPNTDTPRTNTLQYSLTRIATFLGTIALAIGAFFVSIFFFILILTIGLVIAAIFWWKSRKLRRAMRTMREQTQNATNNPPGEIIEGELIREVPPKKPL